MNPIGFTALDPVSVSDMSKLLIGVVGVLICSCDVRNRLEQKWSDEIDKELELNRRLSGEKN